MDLNKFIVQFNIHTPYLRGFAMKLASDKFRAEDLFQDTAVNAFRHWQKFRPDTNMKAWLSTIMKNVFLNQFRKRSRQLELQDTSEDAYLLNNSKTVENEGESNMIMTEITKVIDSLEEDLRTPFLMAYQGYQYDEICQKLGNIPMGTIKSRIHTARKILKSQLLKMHIV